MENQKDRKKRRTEESIRQALFDATEQLIIEKGFQDIAITEIMRRANVEPQVVYKRFKDLDDLFDKFVRQYDYWFHDLVKSYIDPKNPVQSMKDILINLADSLYDNNVMQRILVWEISDRNRITYRMARGRELYSLPLLEFFRKSLPSSTIDFDGLTSALIAGIYYLILHKDVSTFCGIDFKSEDGKKLLLETLSKVIEKIYAPVLNEADIRLQEKIKIARAMIANNIDLKNIEKIIGIPIDEIQA